MQFVVLYEFQSSVLQFFIVIQLADRRFKYSISIIPSLTVLKLENLRNCLMDGKLKKSHNLLYRDVLVARQMQLAGADTRGYAVDASPHQT